jgi:hypothetical protein
MPGKSSNDLSSRELLARIGLSEDPSNPLLDDDPLDDLQGDPAALLRERFQALSRGQAFAPGDLVTWKAGMKNKRVPRYGQPAVVLEVLAQPLRDGHDDPGSTYFREPLDLVLGLIWDSNPGRGEFMTFHYDSRRFRPWQGRA